MKKVFILGIIIGGIIFGTSVYALTSYLYSANEVSYSPSDNSWNVDNVESAIDDLYSKAKTYMPIPTATKSITSNGNNIDVKNYAKVNVNVNSSNALQYTVGQSGAINSFVLDHDTDAIYYSYSINGVFYPRVWRNGTELTISSVGIISAGETYYGLRSYKITTTGGFKKGDTVGIGAYGGHANYGYFIIG